MNTIKFEVGTTYVTGTGLSRNERTISKKNKKSVRCTNGQLYKIKVVDGVETFRVIGTIFTQTFSADKVGKR
jgi:hypothetical protein